MVENMQEKMFAHVVKWQTSGMSQSAYAKSIKLVNYKFRYWVDKYKKINSQQNDSPKFIALESLVGNKKNEALLHETILTEPAKVELELTLPSGLCLKIYR